MGIEIHYDDDGNAYSYNPATKTWVITMAMVTDSSRRNDSDGDCLSGSGPTTSLVSFSFPFFLR